MASVTVNRRGKVPGDIRLETQSALTGRGMRSPRYDYQRAGLEVGQLYPIMFAPVLAGDTIKSASLMARVLGATTDTIPNTRGCWFESWMFYVRVGDMPGAEGIRDLIVDPAATTVIDWRDQAMKAIWSGYFVDEDESLPWSAGPNWLRVPGSNWYDSATDAAALPAPDAGGDEWKTQWSRFEAMRRAKLTTKTFEEYLAAQGVSVPPQLRQEHDPELKVPELLHYSREFVYPQPAGFGVGSAEVFRWQWFIQERLARGRFAAEPGMLVACIAARPKVYVVSDFDELDFLNQAEGWMPIDLDTDPHTSLVEVEGSVFGDTTPGALQVVDMRDLYLFGAQVGESSGDLDPYLADVGAKPRFSYLDGASPPTFNVDATVRLEIASRVSKDTTA